MFLRRRRRTPAPLASYYFSSEPAAATEDVKKPDVPVEFVYPKAQALFEKITATLSTEEEVRVLQRHLYESLGHPLRDNEFYYSGFGSSKAGKGKKGGAAAEEQVVEEKKTAFDVKLVAFDAKAKIKVIKEVRSMAGLGLKEAKELVESAPTTILKGIKPEEAEAAKAKLIELGAEIELV